MQQPSNDVDKALPSELSLRRKDKRQDGSSSFSNSPLGEGSSLCADDCKDPRVCPKDKLPTQPRNYSEDVTMTETPENVEIQKGQRLEDLVLQKIRQACKGHSIATVAADSTGASGHTECETTSQDVASNSTEEVASADPGRLSMIKRRWSSIVSSSLLQNGSDDGDNNNDGSPGPIQRRASDYGPSGAKRHDAFLHGVSLGELLAERVSCVGSIRWLGHHLPETVLAYLIDEIEFEEAEEGAFSEYGDESCLEVPLEVSTHSPEQDDFDDAASDDYAMPNRKSDSRHSSLGGFSDDSTSHRGVSRRVEERPRNHTSASFDMAAARPEHKRRHSLPTNGAFNQSGEQKAKRRPSLPLVVRELDIPVSSNHRQRAMESLKFEASLSSILSGVPVQDSQCDCLSVNVHSCPSSNASFASQSDSSMILHQDSYKDDDGSFFSEDTNDEHLQKMARLRQRRFFRTQDSLRELQCFDIDDCGQAANETQVLNDDFYFADRMPPATRHDCALLFVDISGFTKLSTVLDVEPFSKITNSFFQMIIEEIEAYGGDVLKFAGDALFAEWQASMSNPVETEGMSVASATVASSVSPWHGLDVEECVLTAAACAARIVDRCSDYPVYSSQDTSRPIVATLNVHCGLGFGEVVGVHVGDHKTRMEYLILGDPIEQVSKSMLLAGRGEVVASPEALVMLDETAELDERISSQGMEEPQVIARKLVRFFHPKGTVHIKKNWTLELEDMTTKPRRRLARRCEDWDLPALRRLRQRMSQYVHPVVLNDEFALKVYPGDRYRAQERHRSEAELRRVYTVFIMPLVRTRLTGDDEEDCKVIMLLNDIMLTMTRELARYKGQLRQFIVDDKGVVLIANFGLRGSTFPNMVAERAIPFTTTVQTLLRTELDVECQIGATFGEAYCGIVGGVTRHEYAVLGPSVNLAARLMGSPMNTGFLVDDAIKQKAGSRQFRALPPVKAKGYSEPVPIFEPLLSCERSWPELKGGFVGREMERSAMLTLAQSLLDEGGPAKLVLLAGESGAGKSALCLQTTEEIREMCASRGLPHVISRSMCSEGDAFVPFSIVRPLFIHILRKRPQTEELSTDWAIDNEQIEAYLYGAATETDVDVSLVNLVRICRQDDVPLRYVEIICRLVLTRNRADIVQGGNGASSDVKELESITRFIASAFLRCVLLYDLVVIALDDVTNMDEMSWFLIELVHGHAQNLMIIGTARTVNQEEMHVTGDFWNRLHKDGATQKNFIKIELPPMDQDDIEVLIARSLDRQEIDIDPDISREVFVQSGGMPNLASKLVDQIVENSRSDLILGSSDDEGKESSQTSDSIGRELESVNVGELVLHRMDALPSSVRSHLNLGAVLGHTFELMDVVTAFEQYRSVEEEERFDHAESVHESLKEAVAHSIIEEVSRESEPLQHAGYKNVDHPYAEHNTLYRFTHDVWRSNILRLTLDEFKRDVHNLIAQSMETVVDSQLSNDYRVLTKLFSHWKESGSARKASTLALKTGRSLEEIGLAHQSVLLYTEALDMWRATVNDGCIEDDLGGVSVQFLEQIDVIDLQCLTSLHIALGRCFGLIVDPVASTNSFQTALNIIQKAPSANELQDRSIIFPIISGLFDTLRFGGRNDFKYEVGLVQMFLRETTQNESDLLAHHSRALAMQAEMFARHGKFPLAVDAVVHLREMYKVDEHTAVISQTYGGDRSAQCIAQSTIWLLHIGRTDEALQMCDMILDELLPKMHPRDIYCSFLLLYPILWVLKDNEMALRARNVFDEYVVKRSSNILDERAVTPDKPLHMPILALLDIVGTSCTTEKIEKYSEWVLVDRNGRFCTELNLYLASLGRAADSVTAEMCLLLARHSTDQDQKKELIKKGFELASETLGLIRGEEGESNTPGMAIAYGQIKPIYDDLEYLHSLLPHVELVRRGSCGF